jgi:predicted kinase
MVKLTIVRGVSGSGKSTWAENQNAAVVSRDKIRAGLFGSADQDYHTGPNLKQNEELVTKVEHVAIAEHLSAGRDVISDNTNLRPKFAQAIAEIGFRLGAEVEVKLFDVPLNVAKSRNASRDRQVPVDVIEKQHSQLAGTKDWSPVKPYIPEPYNGTPGKPKAFLVDVDGTLAHMTTRGPFDWKRVGEDDVDRVVADIVGFVHDGSFEYGDPYETIVMSGRDETCRAETEAWLNLHHVPWHKLIMRPAGDMRKDSIVKAELFDRYVRDNYDVQFVLDDRNQVVDMWRAMGLTCLQVAEGNF